MSMSQPHPPEPYDRGSGFSRSFLPLALITLGVVFLLSNMVPEQGRGGLIVIGLGAAFMIGRWTTGRYGYAVPAGILIAIGAYVSTQASQNARGIGGSGLFFVMLGLGFALIYVVGLRPAAIWPLFPAAVLVGLGVILLGVSSLAPLASLSWIAAYWPVALVLLGGWFLLRESLPVPLRRPIATLGGWALLVYGVVAAVTSVAAGGTLARAGFTPGLGASPFADTVTLETSLDAGQTFTVNNPNGRTSIHGGSGTGVHVVATRHVNIGGQAPEVRLAPSPDGTTLDSSSPRGRFPFGDPTSVDYAIEVPASVAIKAQTSRGNIDVNGVNGTVQAQATSGSIVLTNLAGDVQATTSSGHIHGTQLQHLRQAQSTSGSISLEGTFTDAASINALSGSVDLKLLPGSAVQLDIRTTSGHVEPAGGLQVGGAGAKTSRDTLSGAIGTPAPDATLSVRTSSGNVSISQ
jgi:hypothetical protein